jgi:hypothetical protein
MAGEHNPPLRIVQLLPYYKYGSKYEEIKQVDIRGAAPPEVGR